MATFSNGSTTRLVSRSRPRGSSHRHCFLHRFLLLLSIFCLENLQKEVPLLHSKSLKTVKGSRSCSQTVTPQNLRLNEIGFELGTLAFFLLSFPSFSSPNQVRRKKKSSILKFTKLRDRVGEIRIHFLLSL